MYAKNSRKPKNVTSPRPSKDLKFRPKQKNAYNRLESWICWRIRFMLWEV